jgi:predicted regulator of Ras-like GTPase activity (Roadblock/LC7/MglB family)
MLLDLYGHTMIDSGNPGTIDKTILNALLISSMAASQELAQAFQEKRAFDMHYYDGERYEIYLRKVNAEIVMALLIDLQQTKTPIGSIRLHLKRAVEGIKEIGDRLLATEKNNGPQNIEALLPQGSSEFSNSLDELLFGDEKQKGKISPQTTGDGEKINEKQASSQYISLNDAIQQGIIKIDPSEQK